MLDVEIPESLTCVRQRVKIFFVGVPKTGTKFFLNTVHPDDVIPQGHAYFKEISDHYAGFNGGNVLQNLEDAKRELAKEGIKVIVISLVRNPYSMLHSLWNYKWSGTDDRSISWNMKRGGTVSFDDFARAFRDPISPKARDEMGLHFSGFQIAPNFSDFLYFQLFDDLGRFVPDFVIRMECMSIGILQLQKHLGIRLTRSPSRSLSPEKVNGGASCPSSKYKEMYTADLIKFFSKQFSTELDLFGYDFDGSTDDAAIISGADIRREGEKYVSLSGFNSWQ